MCLAGSVDSDTAKKMANESSNCMVQHPTNPNCLEPGRICHLKPLLLKAKLDTRAQNRLTKLNICIIDTAKNNIHVFNECIRDELSKLTSCREQTSNIITNLFK